VWLSPVVDHELKSVRVEIAITHFSSVVHCLLLSYRRSLSHYRRRSCRYHSRPKKKFVCSYLPILLSSPIGSVYALYGEHRMQSPLKSQHSFALNDKPENPKEQVEPKEPVAGRRNREKTKRSRKWRESVSTMFGVTRYL
jgi:hypothetical protein